MEVGFTYARRSSIETVLYQLLGYRAKVNDDLARLNAVYLHEWRLAVDC